MDTQDEICRSYRMAKDRTKQIQIMAELNGVSREEIIKTLVRGGEIPGDETEQNTGSKAKVISEAVVMPCMPRAVRDALFKRIDELEQQIKPLERQMEEQNTGSKAKVISEAVVMPCMPRAVRDALFKRIDELEQQIKPLERQMETLCGEYDQILGFLKGHRCDDAEIEMHSIQ